MIEQYKIKAGDTGPPIFATLYDPDGLPYDLTGAVVRFHMRELSGSIVVDKLADLVNGGLTGGVAFRDWAAADTETAGKYLGEFEVTFVTGVVQSFPRDRAGFDILISEGLA